MPVRHLPSSIFAIALWSKDFKQLCFAGSVGDRPRSRNVPPGESASGLKLARDQEGRKKK